MNARIFSLAVDGCRKSPWSRAREAALDEPAALALLRAGYAVVLAGGRADALEQTLSQAPTGANALVVPTDVRDERRCGTVSAYRQEDSAAWMCCSTTPASVRRRSRSTDLALAQWNDVISVNLTGAFLCARAAFRVMREQSRKAAASSTMAPFRRTRRGRFRRPTPPPSTL